MSGASSKFWRITKSAATTTLHGRTGTPINSLNSPPLPVTHFKLKLIRYRSNESTVKLSSEKTFNFQREISRHFSNPGTSYSE